MSSTSSTFDIMHMCASTLMFNTQSERKFRRQFSTAEESKKKFELFADFAFEKLLELPEGLEGRARYVAQCEGKVKGAAIEAIADLAGAHGILTHINTGTLIFLLKILITVINADEIMYEVPTAWTMAL